jgi:hypothetical protein
MMVDLPEQGVDGLAPGPLLGELFVTFPVTVMI